VFFVLVLLLVVAWIAQTYVKLSHIPGPLLPSLTNISRALWVQSNHAHDIHIALHKKYGKVVRFGPNFVSVQDPKEISQIYNYAGTFAKVQLYFNFIESF
jgi:hypothetical protein